MSKIKHLSAEYLYNELHMKRRMSYQDIATIYNCTRGCVCKKMTRAGYVGHRNMPRHNRDLEEFQDGETLSVFLDSCLSYSDASRKLGVDRQVLCNWCRYFRVERRFDHSGAKNPMWRGGVCIDHNKDGRVLLNCHGVDYYSFNPSWKNNAVTRAKFIMETQVLNQPLPAGYVVHHMNQTPDDDRVENLGLLSRSEHAIIHDRLRKTEGNGPRAKKLQELIQSLSDHNISKFIDMKRLKEV